MISAFCRAIAAMCLFCVSTLAQTQSTGLIEPKALAVHGDSGHVFILEAGTGRLLRWNLTETTALSDRFLADSSLASMNALCFREGNLLTAVGMSGDGHARVATYKADVSGSLTAEEGLTSDLELDGLVRAVSATCATDFAIFLAVVRADESQRVWRVPAGRTSLGKAGDVIEDVGDSISSMTISPRGHLVLAVHTATGAPRLRFHHAETGRLLLSLESDLQEVTSLAFSPSGLLYAIGNKSNRDGVFRLDVFFDGARQAVRSTEIAKLDKIVGIDFSHKGDCVVLVGGKQDGRALIINVN